MTDTSGPIYLDATLTPNRSMSPRAFLIVMAIVGAVSFVAGLGFLSMGAFPVLGFFGLDALIIWLAFRFSFRALKQETRLQVTAEAVTLRHVEPGRGERSARVPTGFVRVDLHYPERAPSQLRLAYGGKAWVIGSFLTEGERKGLKAALDAAIQRARAERFLLET